MNREELRARLFGSGPGPVWGVVLGSGFDVWLQKMSPGERVFFGEVDGLIPPTVQGHKGYLAAGTIGGQAVVVAAGRLHLYEGLTAAQVVEPVRVLVSLGVTSVLLTTAAGSVNRRLEPGDAVVITDQINLTGEDPHVGTGLFPEVSALYDPLCASALARKGLKKAVLAGVRGPSYETPAEVVALESMGADIVCMSTVLEGLALAGTGVKCAGVGIVANRAGSGGVGHNDVLKTVGRSAELLWPAVLDLIACGSE